MSETDPNRPSPALELLTLLAAGADRDTAPLPEPADPARDLPGRADLRELLTDGIVELRKRGEIAAQRPADALGAAHCLETMARRAAERAGRPRA